MQDLRGTHAAGLASLSIQPAGQHNSKTDAITNQIICQSLGLPMILSAPQPKKIIIATQQTLLCTNIVKSVKACTRPLSPQATIYVAVAQLHLWRKYSMLFGHMALHGMGPLMDRGLKAAPLGSAPPNLSVGVGWAFIRSAGVVGVVPLSSHFWKQGLKRIACASFTARATRAARAETHATRCCLPSVKLPLWTTMADPVALFSTSACYLVGVQACFGVQLFMPEVHDRTGAVSQHRMLLLGL